METRGFDRFTKSVATATTRRRVVQLLAALPLGGALATGRGAAGAHAKGRRRSRRVDGQIVGGRPVVPGALPFLAYIETALYACGGSVIAPHYVLTAAHCTGPNEGKGPVFPVSDYYVGIGQVNLDALESKNSFGVVNVTRHPQWDSTPGSSVAYDVAILQLDRAVPADVGRPVAVVGAGDTRFAGAGQSVRVAGWGLTSTGGTPSTSLLEVDVNIVGDQQCVAAYGGVGIDPVSEICAGAPGRDSCQGDSGGPLFVEEFVGTEPAAAVRTAIAPQPAAVVQKKRKKKKKKNKHPQQPPGALYTWTQVGIVSFGRDCADPVAPGVYARISDPAISSFIAGVIG